MLDEITRAVLSSEEITKYLKGSHSDGGHAARERIEGYLDELRTRQRYSIYRALKHPLYPILRKIERVGEHVDVAKAAARAGRVVYASNHRSHTDYLIEPLVLDDNGIRPPIIAAGINLFGGPLGLIHRHVTGAIPIRRNTKDQAYLLTLKAYVAELLRTHDFFFYPEGGRSYSGELKIPKTGLMHAALQAQHPHMVVLPTAVAYDVVLEDHVLARQRVKRSQRPFSRELAEMVRYAVGYRSRAYVTFGTPIPIGGNRPRFAPRRARSESRSHARHRTHLQGAAHGGRGLGHTAVDHPARAGAARGRAHRHAGRRGREPRRDQRCTRSGRGRRAARIPRYSGGEQGTRSRAQPERPPLLRTLDRPPARIASAPDSLAAGRRRIACSPCSHAVSR